MPPRCSAIRTATRIAAAALVALGAVTASTGVAQAGSSEPFVGPVAVASTTTTTSGSTSLYGTKATSGIRSTKAWAKRIHARRTGATRTTTTNPSQRPAPTATTAPAPVTDLTGLRQPMPKGDLNGWRQVMAEDFGAPLPSDWVPYHGQPGGNPGGWWEPSHVAVRDSKLVLDGHRVDGRFVTGGVMATGTTLTYGKYEVRFRMDKGHGVKYALLLWPASERWPIDGEIDFAEDGGGDRTGTAATLHWGADNSQVQHKIAADFSQWQTIGVEWTPGKLVYTLNGQPWGTVTGDHVPSTAMRLALQSEAGTCGDAWTPCPDATTPEEVDLEIDWAVAYARS